MFEYDTRANKTSLYGLFRARALTEPHSLAVVFEENTLTYSNLLNRVDCLASALLMKGIKKGERIAILSRNRPEYLELELAAAAIGVIVACLNWRLLKGELSHCVSLVEPSLIIAEQDLANTISEITDLPILILGSKYEAALAEAPAVTPVGNIDPEDGLLILYSSGTTGLPKGAVISHRAMIARSLVFTSELGIAPDDGFIAWAPFYHMASTDHALATLLRGGPVIVIDGYQPDEILNALAQYPIGWFVLIPGMIASFIEAFKETLITPAGIVVCGAMADLVPPQEIAEVTKLLCTPYLNSFGSTETGLPPATRSVIQPGVLPTSLSKQQSAFCEIRLVDENDMDVPDGEPGELLIRSATLFSGYWNAHETNAKDFRGGWFHLGDVFRRTPDGLLDFVDRAKYMIKSGGENIYPAEIERVLLAEPDITDVAVVKAKDERWGEVPVAFVSLTDSNITADELKACCRQALATYKCPREIRIIKFDDFPRSTSGKIQRHILEDRLNNGSQ